MFPLPMRQQNIIYNGFNFRPARLQINVVKQVQLAICSGEKKCQINYPWWQDHQLLQLMNAFKLFELQLISTFFSAVLEDTYITAFDHQYESKMNKSVQNVMTLQIFFRLSNSLLSSESTIGRLRLKHGCLTNLFINFWVPGNICSFELSRALQLSLWIIPACRNW